MRESWRPRPADRVVRHPRQDEIRPVHFTVTTRRVQPRYLASPFIIIYAFAGLIAIGTLLLLLPFTQHEEGFTPFLTAFFTATSAVTVTGLVVEETAAYWTRTGQVFILGMMFVGGLGFMVIATFLLIIIGQRITLSQRLLVRESLGVPQLGGLVGLTVKIVSLAIGLQIVGFVALAVRFSFIYSPAEAIWQAVFHSVSAFNNAGFLALTEPEGLIAFRGDEVVLGILGVLIVLGGLSFYVINDIVSVRRFSRYSLNSKLVLVMTVALIFLGTLVFMSAEYQNPDTLGPRPVEEKFLDSLFQSVISRTGGFTVVDMGDTHKQTNFFFTSLMFIGGASASVAGGIKVNTLAVILVAILSTLRGRSNSSAFGREIPHEQVQRAMVIGALSTSFVFAVALLLSFSEGVMPFIDLLFEAVSAFGTVGLSAGITPDLSVVGKLVIIFTMFLGRLGPLTIGLALAQRTQGDMYRYPQERVTIG